MIYLKFSYLNFAYALSLPVSFQLHHMLRSPSSSSYTCNCIWSLLSTFTFVIFHIFWSPFSSVNCCACSAMLSSLLLSMCLMQFHYFFLSGRAFASRQLFHKSLLLILCGKDMINIALACNGCSAGTERVSSSKWHDIATAHVSFSNLVYFCKTSRCLVRLHGYWRRFAQRSDCMP